MHEIVAISIGRVGLMHSTVVAPLLGDFAEIWCRTLCDIDDDDDEKDSAFRGLCTMICENPLGVTTSEVPSSLFTTNLLIADLTNSVYTGSASLLFDVVEPRQS